MKGYFGGINVDASSLVLSGYELVKSIQFIRILVGAVVITDSEVKVDAATKDWLQKVNSQPVGCIEVDVLSSVNQVTEMNDRIDPVLVDVREEDPVIELLDVVKKANGVAPDAGVGIRYESYLGQAN